MEYNKLVRDNIPDIIRKQGENPYTRILDDEAYTHEELADILEVVYALAENMGNTKEELHRVYKQKHEARGGFQKRIFLISKDG